MPGSTGDVTQLLNEFTGGDREALDRLIPLVEAELRRIARRHLRRERIDHTLQTTALINEAYIKLVEQRGGWQNRAHFFSICARLMRRILVDHARKKKAAKREGDRQRVTLPDFADASEPAFDLLDVDRALEELYEVEPRQARVIELRFFAQMTNKEIATALDIAVATVKRDRARAKEWLQERLAPGGDP